MEICKIGGYNRRMDTGGMGIWEEKEKINLYIIILII